MAEPLSGQDAPEQTFIFSSSFSAPLKDRFYAEISYHPHDVQIEGMCRLFRFWSAYGRLHSCIHDIGSSTILLLFCPYQPPCSATLSAFTSSAYFLECQDCWHRFLVKINNASTFTHCSLSFFIRLNNVQLSFIKRVDSDDFVCTL
jgi:hypothetical protein